MPPREQTLPGLLPAALKERLKTAPGGAYVFYGPEELLKTFYLEKFTSLIEDEGMAAFNLVRLDFSAEATWEDVEREVNTMPAMAPHRLILCRSVPLNEMTVKEAEALEKAFPSFPEDVILILYQEEGELKAEKKTLNKKPLQILQRIFTFCYFPLQPDRVLIPWAKKILARDGVSIEDAALAALIRLSEGKMAVMRGELDKIALYCAAKGMARADEKTVLLFARDNREFAIWNLCDAILDGASRAAEHYYRNLLRQKVHPLAINAAVSRHLTQCVYVLEGAGDDEIKTLTGLDGWRLQNRRRALYGKSKATLEKAMALCARLDRKLKGDPVDGEILCEKTILAVTGLLGGAA